MPTIDPTQLALERAIEGASLRQQVLAANVANANTPGYVRRDVDFHTALQGALDSADPGRRTAALQRLTVTPTSDPLAARRADGGGVDVEQENAALAANSLEHAALIQVARARMDILEAALGAR